MSNCYIYPSFKLKKAMALNNYVWNLYKESEEGKKAIELFTEGPIEEIISRYGGVLEKESVSDSTLCLSDYCIKPVIPGEMNTYQAGEFFKNIVSSGFILKYNSGEIEKYTPINFDMLENISVISSWLYSLYSDFFIPYLLKNRFKLLTQVADFFGLKIPEVPLKKDKVDRIIYYWQLCLSFMDFQDENKLTPQEFCAFLYDFAPAYISDNTQTNLEMPKPSQVWMVGGNKKDFPFLDASKQDSEHWWQGNIDTKRGDIIVMYCLTPRSCIHSIWRATADGFADPFFHYYSNIYIGDGIKINPISFNELRDDEYFKTHPLIRKKLQGVNGYALTSDDYQRIQQLIIKNGGSTDNLPQLYSPSFSNNKNLTNERDVEVQLVEPLLLELGFVSDNWIRQLSVRMGRGERSYPDYTFLTKKDKGYEEALMIIEVKFWIKNNKELEEAFKQAWSYAQRLTARIIVLADKDCIWIYERVNSSFDRSRYTKKYWKEIERLNDFKVIKQLIGPK